MLKSNYKTVFEMEDTNLIRLQYAVGCPGRQHNGSADVDKLLALQFPSRVLQYRGRLTKQVDSVT